MSQAYNKVTERGSTFFFFSLICIKPSKNKIQISKHLTNHSAQRVAPVIQHLRQIQFFLKLILFLLLWCNNLMLIYISLKVIFFFDRLFFVLLVYHPSNLLFNFNILYRSDVTIQLEFYCTLIEKSALCQAATCYLKELHGE